MRPSFLLLLLLLLTSCMEFHAGAVPRAPKGASFATIDGTRVHYVDEGKGPPVVLIHGFASSLNAWNGVRKALVPSHRVIALDLKGFGHTSRPDGDYSPAAQAKVVLGLLEELGVEGKVDLVAHSWGSSVALALTLAAPERVNKIALYDAWVFEDQLPTAFIWSRAPGMGELLIGAFYDQRPDDKIAMAFHDQKYVTEELIEVVEDQLSRPGTKAAALAAIRGQHFAELEPKYKTIKQPVLLLWGREDRVTTLEFGERLSKELPDAKLNVYPQCGHFPMIEAVRPSTRDLVDFLKSTASKPSEPEPAPKPAPPPPAPSSTEAAPPAPEPKE